MPSAAIPRAAPATHERVRRVSRVTHARRYGEIIRVLVRHGFVDVVEAMHLAPYRAAGRRVLTAIGRRQAVDATRAVRIRLALEELGPTFIKFGQALSTRADLLPPDVIAELSRLQDRVPSLPPGMAEAAIEDALGRLMGDLFAEFDPVPLAAASIAQVHQARLHSGELVAVKVRRPGIAPTIEADLAILADLARVAERRLPNAALYSLSELVDEFARTIRRELDLAREGRLAERIASQFAGDPTVRFPAVCWPLTSTAVLTMEFLSGTRISAVGTAAAPGLDPALVARRVADVVLKQVLITGLFHADPHPGNVLVLPGNVVAFVDFGIVGRVRGPLRQQLTEVILAIAQRDAERIADIVVHVATPLEPVNMAALSSDIDDMIDTYAGLTLGELPLGEVLSAVTTAMSRHRLKMPADLLLLIKTVTTIEGVGRTLDPSFQMVEYASPLVQQLVAEQHTPAALALRGARAGRDVMAALRALPGDVAELAQRTRRDGLRVQFVHRNLEHFTLEMDRASNRLSFANIIAAIVIGSSVMVHAAIGPTAFGYPLLGVLGFLVAGVLGLGLAVGILRSGRL